MAVLSNDAIRDLLAPFVADPIPDPLVDQLSIYLDLLVRWNARINLTSIRNPEEIVQRHFGESLFTAEKLSKHLQNGSKLLDFGSGAGFPGLPIQLRLPEAQVTLAESQARKVAFLREVIRSLDLSTQVWPKRVEEMQAEQFDVVTLRAVEKMSLSIDSAAARVSENGWLAALVGIDLAQNLPIPHTQAEEFLIPGSSQRRLILLQIVPRGTI